MEHHFNTDLAKEYGVNCAILIDNISYWIHKNQCDNRHFYDGRYWTYISRQGMVRMFPYLSEKQIGYALQKLIDNDILMVGNYNKNTFDRTKWYAFTDNGLDLIYDLTKGNNRIDKRSVSNNTKGNHRCDKRETCVDSNIYINNTTDTDTDTNTNTNKGADAPLDEIFNLIDFDFDKNLIAPLLEFAKMRKGIKKPLTPYAMKLNVSQLQKMSADVNTQIAIVNQSVQNCWQGFYALNDGQKGQASETEMKPTEGLDELEKQFMRGYPDAG